MGAYVTMCLLRSEDNAEKLVSSFHHESSSDQTQVISPSRWIPYLLSHLTMSYFFFIFNIVYPVSLPFSDAFINFIHFLFMNLF